MQAVEHGHGPHSLQVPIHPLRLGGAAPATPLGGVVIAVEAAVLAAVAAAGQHHPLRGRGGNTPTRRDLNISIVGMDVGKVNCCSELVPVRLAPPLQCITACQP